jgi:peptide/nickel transport system permease protein
VSVSVGFFSTLVAAALGVPMGLVAGYFGGWWDAAIMRLTDSLLAFPAIVLAMAIVSVMGSSLRTLIIAIGLVQVPRFSRLLRALTLSISQMDYVKAARVLGAGDVYILRRAILPNALRVTLVQLSLTFATAVITEAALSFLGLGAQPPTPSWGLMLDLGRQLSSMNIAYPLAAGTAIFATVLLFTLLGDVLSDVLDPHEG